MLLRCPVPFIGLDQDDKRLRSLTDELGLPGAKIRCPRCAWVPRATDRWECTCGYCWNTFDTRGLCPACDYQWTDTACLACHEWSPHEDWYVR